MDVYITEAVRPEQYFLYQSYGSDEITLRLTFALGGHQQIFNRFDAFVRSLISPHYWMYSALSFFRTTSFLW